VPRFEPFAGIRYNPEAVAIDRVIAPPYDVIGPDELHRLEERSPHNVVYVDLSRDEAERDKYTAAGCRFDEWLAQEILLNDPEPSFYVYRMGYHDSDGRPRQTSGAIGALELSVPGEGDVLPHERTMSKPKDDRLNVMRACRANLSPIWVLSLAEGLSALCELPGPPDLRATDDEGVHHRLWRITQPGVVSAIADAVRSAPVVIADGHHRYETALAYRDERRQASPGPGAHDLIMAYAVELAEEQLSIRPIHRLLTGLAPDFDLVGFFSQWFEPFDGGPPTESLSARMADAGALALVLPDQAWLLRPRETSRPGVELDLERSDADRFAEAAAALPRHDLAYQHGAGNVVAMVEKGEAQAGVLLRPVSVAQMASAARAAHRLPEKTTFFYPKPATGLVFRRVVS
jgi:uncharacterized protein (DUF1015 family)